jgi:Ca-activated chloride channel homolog
MRGFGQIRSARCGTSLARRTEPWRFDVKRLVLLFALLPAAVSALVAPQPQGEPPQPPAVFRSSTSLVALNVTVTDPLKRFVTGLKSDDFQVFEDGIQQRVQFFEATDVPIDLILLIDGSSSMRDKMKAVQEAALGFLNMLREKDRGAVVAFSDTVTIVQTLTADREQLQAAVRSTRAYGTTALHTALYVSLKEFGRAAQQGPDVRRQAIAVLSDGEDTSSLVTFDDVLALARRSGVSIYAIRMQSEMTPVRARADQDRVQAFQSAYAMKTLAQDTGGQAFFPQLVGDLKNIYAGIAEELSAQYSIGYTPTNGRRDGRFRRILVRLPSQPDLRTRARAGYTADADRTAALMNGDKQR